ncbi:hypothetical protein HMPREF0083_04754 [Aneurinibacillus aneurinilyticus ATCC 12856]|uniref:Uncharacterized protein n=1 Tax=Aneurinibacillus aneurinilyticus ATCC 12856 TaxID=649747 RepID=U1WWW8_ANEAE|nr:hypothetical protein HMPREF0083_04754 [Aneurinibacillus aneurinilyticus ATCC 12856]
MYGSKRTGGYELKYLAPEGEFSRGYGIRGYAYLFYSRRRIKSSIHQ